MYAPTTRMYAPTRKCSLSVSLRVVCGHVRECVIYLTRMCSLRVVCEHVHACERPPQDVCRAADA